MLERIAFFVVLGLVVLNLVLLNREVFGKKVCVFDVQAFVQELSKRSPSEGEIALAVKVAKEYLKRRCSVVFAKGALIEGEGVYDVTKEVLSYVSAEK